MKYVLHVMSYEGIVPWAAHYKGRVEGEYPPSCHGGTGNQMLTWTEEQDLSDAEDRLREIMNREVK